MPAQMIDEDLINKSLLESLNLNADHDALSSSPDDDDDDLYHLRSRPDSPYRQQPHLHQQLNSNPFNHISSRATFNSFPNTNRRQQTLPVFYQNSPHNLDPYAQPYDARTHSEHAISQSNQSNPRPYLIDQFSAASRPLSQQPQQQSASSPFATGVSQTPYGPHVPSTAVPLTANLSTSTTASSTQQSNALQNGSVTSTVSGEEISTIFVVGFPDDMQEREFQNMFTFSAGFEAATLKIPNKEYTAYGSLVQPPTALANGVPVALNGLRGPSFQPYAGSNDPYNLVTVNQGGVVVDGGRDGTMASWPAANPHALSEEALVNAHLFAAGPGGPIPSLAAAAAAAAAGQTSLSLPPRKQIIGFAKFRSRAEALQARDVLQGRRVDIEKGAVLKAEMAKKNLHTKRGVGPVAGVGVGGVAPGGMGNNGMPLTVGQNQSGQQMQQQHINESFAPQDNSFSSNPQTVAQDASVHHSMSRMEEEQRRQRDRENSITMSLISAIPMSTSSSISSTMSLNGRQQEEDERQRETWARRRSQQEKDNIPPTTRLRNSSSYDFNNIPIGSVGISRGPNGANINGSSTGSVKEGSVTGSPMLEYEGLNVAAQFQSQSQVQLETHHETRDEGERGVEQETVVGPWDRINLSSSASGLLSPTGLAPARPRSESQRSMESENPQHQISDLPISSRASAIGTPAPPPSAQELSMSVSSSSPPVRGPGEQGNGNVDYPSSLASQSRLSGFSAAAKQAESSGIPSSVTSPMTTNSLPPIVASATSTSSTGPNGTNASNGINYSNGQSSTGTTSPQLPSPASGGSISSSNLSLMGGNNSGLAQGLVGGAGAALRGTVDQNPPINTLYVGNLPTSPPPAGYPNDYLEETLRELFQARPGFRKLCFRHKANGPMCFVEFEDVHFAARAMQEMTGNTLRGTVKNGIRLSYSKNPLGVRTPTSAGSNGGPTMQQQQQLMQTLSNHHNHQHQAQQIAHHLSQGGLPHHVVQQIHAPQQPQHHQQQHHSQLSYTSSVGGHDPYRIPEELAAPHHRPNAMMRRDSQMQGFNSLGNGATSPVGGMPNGYYSSGSVQGQQAGQPPRFYTTSPPANASSTLTGNSNVFVPRLGGLNGNNYGGPGAAGFAPFGVPDDGSFGMMDQMHQHHQQ